MKELVYKTREGNNPVKREFSIEEHENQHNSLVDKKWICKYFIRSRYQARSQGDLTNWISKRQVPPAQAKKCHVLRNVNTKTNVSTILYKVIGTFFVVNGLVAFNVKYVNILRINIASVLKGAKNDKA